MTDYFNKDWKLYELTNQGFNLPEALQNGFVAFRTTHIMMDNVDLICERYYNRRVAQDLYRVHVEVVR